jgi:glycosyltransferase involved in cell wall biosynthesis
MVNKNISRTRKKVITIGIPCFNEEENVERTYRTITKLVQPLKNYTFQFLFTDNGSTDNTRQKISNLVKKEKRITGVFLSRNFGFEASIAALMNHAQGDALVVIPCDLQDPPELILKFIKKWEEGYKIVAGKYLNTEDDLFTAFLRRTFYFIFKKISNLDIPVNTSEVALLDKKAYQALQALPEKFRFFRGLRVWIGFPSTFIHYRRQKRLYGKSAYNFISYFQYAERGIYGFSYLLLDLMMYATLALAICSFSAVTIYILYHLVTRTPNNTIITVLLAMFFFSSVQLFGLGILGKYIQVIVEETKNRPVYIVDTIVHSK